MTKSAPCHNYYKLLNISTKHILMNQIFELSEIKFDFDKLQSKSKN